MKWVFHQNGYVVSKLLKNSALYTTVMILQNAMNFFLLPLYTSYLTPEDYGIVAVVTSVISILTIVFTLALSGAANRYYFKYKNDEKRLKQFWGTLFWFTILNSFVLSFVFFCFRKVLLEPFASGIAFNPYILIGLISVTLNPAFLFFQSCVRATQNGKIFALNNFLFFLSTIVLTISFVVVFELGAVGVLLARAGTNLVFFVVTFIAFVPKIAFNIRKNDLKIGLKYSLPLIPHSLFGWTSSTIDRLLINKLRTTSEVGLYNVGAQFGLLMSVFTSSVNQAYAPWFLENIEKGDHGKQRIISVSSFLVGVYSFLGLGLALFSPELVMFMTKASFHKAWIAIPLITFGYVFGGIYYVVCNSLFIKKTYLVPLVTVAGAVATVVLNLVLIPKWGMMGAAVASMASQFITSVVVVYVSMKVEPIKYKWRKMYFVVLLAFVFSLASFALVPWSVTGIALKFVILIVFLTGFYFSYNKDFLEVTMVFKRFLKIKGSPDGF